MNVKEYYEQQKKNQEWFTRFYSCHKDYDGSMFKFLNTNRRKLLSFEDTFSKFLKYENLPRNKWAVSEKTGQELAKQYVAPMTETLLFSSSRQNNQLIYTLTARGRAFKAMLENNFSDNEKTLLITLFIINASFNKTPRYIIKKATEVFSSFDKIGITNSILKEVIVEFLKVQDNLKIVDIFEYDIVWLKSFYSDENFLKLFSIADNTIKNQLKEIAITGYKQSNKSELLSWKYKGTNFQKATLIDTLTLLYLTLSLESHKENNEAFEAFIQSVVKDFSLAFMIDCKKVLDFIFKHYDMFKIIFENFISNDDDFTEKYITPYKARDVKIKMPTEKIDTTSKEGIEKLEIVREVLKQLAKEKAQYRCALESLNQCRYFTGREENNNFLEIHHLIPREFSYVFVDTIEFVENYVPLCPHCHRMIHKAVDRERTMLINYLFNQRIKDLKSNTIDIDIKGLYEFYKVS